MANIENLMPIQLVNARKTQEERRQTASKAGKASGKAKRKKKMFKDLCQTFLNNKIPEGEIKEKMIKLGLADEDISYKMAMVISMANEAIKGNTKAFELIRDTIGEKPKDKLEIDQDKPVEVNISVKK